MTPEQRTNELIDVLPVLVLAFGEDGDVVLANHRWTQYTGISPSTARRGGWAEAIHPDQRAGVVQRWREHAAARSEGELDLQLRGTDGTWRWFRLRIAPDHRAASVGAFLDIDLDRRRVAELMASERDARLMVNSIPGLISTMTGEGEVEFVNQPLLDYFGLDVAELQRWKMGDVVHPDDLPGVVDAWLRSVTTGKPYDVEHRIRRADGVYRWFHIRGRCQRDGSGRIERWYNVITDVDEQRAAEDRLRRSEARLVDAIQALRAREHELSLIVETIPALVWCAAPDGAITVVNRRILDYVGLSFDDVVASWSDLVHPDDRDGMVRAWTNAIATGSPLFALHRFRGKDGFYHWMATMAQLGRDEAGRPARWYGVLIDIDDQRRTEEALSETRARLTRAAQVAAVAELSASIAHEINQPLTSVVSSGQACVNWLAADPPNVARALTAAERIVRDGTHAGEIIGRLRKLFKRGPVHRVPLSMNVVVADIIEVVRRDAIRRHASIRIDLDARLPTVSGDRVQLQQVLLNLINNAFDAMDGVVTRTRTLAIRTAIVERDVVVAISDSGVGLEDTAKVFEPFFTTKGQGLGMGLVICRWIVEAHDGRLWAEPGDEHGARFCIALPLAMDHAGVDADGATLPT